MNLAAFLNALQALSVVTMPVLTKQTITEQVLSLKADLEVLAGQPGNREAIDNILRASLTQPVAPR